MASEAQNPEVQSIADHFFYYGPQETITLKALVRYQFLALLPMCMIISGPGEKPA